MPPSGGHPQSRAERTRLRGVPEARFEVGAPAALPDVRARRLLRQLAQPPRHEALPRDRPPDHRRLRPARRVGLVLRRRGDARPHGRHHPAERPDPALRLRLQYPRPDRRCVVMQLGMIGLGRMGANMTRRLLAAGHQCSVYDIDPAATARLVGEGAKGAASPRELVEQLSPPRVLWLMVAAAFVDETLERFAPLLAPGDVLIDGGNSRYHDDIRRARELGGRGLHFVDVGTSGGVFGLERGYCLMIGGEAEIVRRLEPIFATLAPPPGTVSRTPGRDGEPRGGERGFLHCGPHGAGHFVKMVHNGIEYGLMASYAEGFNILRHADAGRHKRAEDAETTPLEHPEHYAYELDVPEIAELWRRGSVIGSWLLDLTASALRRDPQLESFAGRVSDSGEGRWTIQAAVEEGVPAPALTAALYARFGSRGADQFANQLLSALRSEFGGHREKSEST